MVFRRGPYDHKRRCLLPLAAILRESEMTRSHADDRQAYKIHQPTIPLAQLLKRKPSIYLADSRDTSNHNHHVKRLEAIGLLCEAWFEALQSLYSMLSILPNVKKLSQLLRFVPLRLYMSYNGSRLYLPIYKRRLVVRICWSIFSGTAEG
jgi:hypothetical protein